MKLLIISALALLSLVGCATTVVKPTDNAAIIDAQFLGKTLYEAISGKDGSEAHTSRESDLLEMLRAKEMACEGTYKAVSTFNHSQNEENLFLVLVPDEAEGVQFGRHFRFRFKLGTNDLIDITPSTKSCLLVPATGDSIPYATHLLSETPTEFHVFLSLYHNKEIYVSTSSGIWSVKGGLISKIEK